MKSKIIVLGFLLAPLFAAAQVNEEFSEINDDIEMVRSMAELERRAVMERGLNLSAEESAKFWPLYDDYTAHKKRINDKMVKLITDYAANYEDLSDELAISLVNDSLRVQSDLLKNRKKYTKKFRRVLEPRTLARFHQIENKLDAVANLTLARGIPLVVD